MSRVIQEVTNPDGRELLFLSYEQCEELAIKLARKLYRKENPLKAIVGMGRGGWFPAMLIGYELKIPHMGNISLSSYSVAGEHNELRLIDSVTPKIRKLDREHKGSVALIDDLVDTGKTVKYVRENILPNCHVGVLHAKPAGEYLADTFVKRIRQDVWIYYPWNNQKIWIPRPPVADGRK